MNARRLWCATSVLLLAPALVGLAADKDAYGDPLPEGAKARLGTARLRVLTYTPPVLTPDGKSLLVQSGSGLARFDPATGATQTKTPIQFFGNNLVLSADGKRIASIGGEGATVWDPASGKSLVKVERRLPGTEDAVALSTDGTVLALGGTGDRVKKEPVTVLVWDVTADKELKKIAVPQNDYANVALSGSGKALATWGSYSDPAAKEPPDPETNLNRFVTFWDAATGKELSKFRVAGYTPAGVVFSPDGALAAVASNNSTIDLVDAKTGASKHLLLGRTRMGRSMSFSPDGATLAASAEDGAVQRWKVADGSRLSTTEPPGGPVFNTRVRSITAERPLAWGARGTAAVIWELPSGRLISPEGGHTAAVSGVTITPDNKHVLTSSADGTTLKWELATGKPAGAVPIRTPNFGFGGYGQAAALSADVTRALVRDPSGGIGVHDLATGGQQYVIPIPLGGWSNAAFSPDGARIVVASASYETKKVPAQVTVWDAATSKRLAAIDLPGIGQVAAALTPDGKHLVTAGQKPSEKGNGEFVITAWEVASGAKKGEFSEEGGFSPPHVAAAPDNKAAAVVTTKGRLVAFDITTGKLGKTYELNRRRPAVTPVFSHDGKKLAVATQAEYGPTPGAPVLVLDWTSGETKYTFAAPAGVPGGMTFSPDGKWLVTGSPDTTAIVWDVSK